MYAGKRYREFNLFFFEYKLTKSRKLVIISVIKPSSGPFSKDIYALVFNMKTVYIQGDQKVSVQLMITMQKVTNNVRSVPRQSPDIY
jgi:hypothetical protein